MTRVLWLAVLACVVHVQCRAMSQDELEDFSNFLLKTSSLDLHVKSAEPDDVFDEDEVVSDHAWEDSGKFEGDLILNDRQRRLIVETVEGLARNGLKDSTKRWPNNEVIYFIQNEHFNGGQMQAIKDGIDDLGQASCVKFRPYRKGDRDAVVIQGSRRGCFSQVGYQGGFQVLNLSGRHPVGRGCFRHGTVVHELLHTLGFYHMQSSPDRDDYINVVWSNIVQPARHNFRKYNSFSVSDFGVGYDYDSVLHYSRRAFSANGQDTLVPKQSGAEIGQRVGLSDKDTQKLNKMYCDADNDAVQADENTTQKPKHKKKKPKNQPFEGQGIGYHQGKTVVIMLPAAQPLSNVPSTHVFDFSTTPQVVSTPEAAGYQFGKEVTYLYKPVISLNTETTKEYQNSYEIIPISNNNKQPHQAADGSESSKKDTAGQSPVQHPNDLNSVKPKYVPIDEYDKDLEDAFHRLTKIVKQHVYPQNQDYIHKVNKDYSKFSTPLQPKKSKHTQNYLGEKYIQPMSNSSLTLTSQNQDTNQGEIVQYENPADKQKISAIEDRMDTFRTSLPTKRPYNLYEQTETPYYASLEYLKNRNDYSKLYSPKPSERYTDENPDNDNKYEHNIQIAPYHDQKFYTDYVKENDRVSITNASKDEKNSKEDKANEYKVDEISVNTKVDLKKKLLEDKTDFSYGILLPSKKPYSAYQKTETPPYATLEYLKDRHDINSFYKSRAPDLEKRKGYDNKHENMRLATVGDWNSEGSNKHNPKYRDSYSGHRQQESKENKEGPMVRMIDKPEYDDDDYDDDNSTELPNKGSYEDYTHIYDENESNERVKESSKYNNDESNEEPPKHKQTEHTREHYNYYTDDQKGDNGYTTEDAPDDDEQNEE